MNSRIVLGILLPFLMFSLVVGVPKGTAYSTAHDYATVTFYYQNGNSYSTQIDIDINITNPEDNGTYFGSLPLEFITRWDPAFPMNVYLSYSIDDNQTLSGRDIGTGSGFHGGPPFTVGTETNTSVDISALGIGEHKITISAQLLTGPYWVTGNYTFAPIFFSVNSSITTTIPTPSPSPTLQPTLEPTQAPSSPSSTISSTLTPSPSVPELPTLIILPILIMAGLAVIVVAKRKRT